jgi:hypothetical protein
VIDQALIFLTNEVNVYLTNKLDPGSTEKNIILFNVSHLGDGTGTNDSPANAFLTLVNIEEDRISKSSENFVRNPGGGIVYKNPKIYLNMYLLFSVSLSAYDLSLQSLSYIIQFFQYKNVFTQLNSSALPAGIDELIMDLHTVSFQDLNNLWGIMGSKYLPSVMYKMRLITISENFAQGNAPLINEIMINDKSV